MGSLISRGKLMSTHNRTISHKTKITRTALATAVATALGIMPIHQVTAAETNEKSATVDEVLVTVRKRQETLQEIPATVQALSEDFLDEVGAKNMEDYTRFIPGVTLISYTPGSSNIIFRGISTGLTDFIAVAGASVYLNESSITSVGAQPDVRMLDIAGVQALAGPQGTIYGGSAQAGIMRIQTNQPDLSGFEGSIEAGVRSGPESDASYNLSAVLNIPLSEQFGIRLAAETAEDGGFIDNVLGYTPDGHEWARLPAMSGTLNNSNVVENNWNGVEYSTFRVSARWEPNDNWAISLMYQDQTNEGHGANDYNPFVGDLQTVYFNQNYRKDEWDVTSLTIEGDLGWAQLVSATSFYQRYVDNSYDGTVYFKYYNQWCNDYFGTYTGADIWYARYCLGTTADADFTGDATDPFWNESFTQEIRLSHQGDEYDWLAGVFYEEGNDNWDNIWMRPTATSDGNTYQESISLLYWETLWGTEFPNAQTTWLSTDRTDWTQVAVFGEFTWHVTDKTDLTIGGRYFQRDNDKLYLVYGPDTQLRAEFLPGERAAGIASGSDSDFVPKINLSYKLSDSKMIYGLYSEGFRPGGTNRGRGELGRTTFPRVFKADNVANYELGAKTHWAENTLQINVSLFHMAWTDYQLEVVDPSNRSCLDDDGNQVTDYPVCDQPWQKVVGNAGDAHTTGLQVEVSWVPADGWEVGGNTQWLEAETDSAVLVADITPGMSLPNVPEWKTSGWLSHRWNVDFIPGAEMVFRGQFSYTGESLNQLAVLGLGDGNPLLTNDAFTIIDFSLGITSSDREWDVSLYVNNATDERAQYFNNTGLSEYPFSNSGANGGAPYEHYHRVYTNRPMEYGIRVKYNWGD